MLKVPANPGPLHSQLCPFPCVPLSLCSPFLPKQPQQGYTRTVDCQQLTPCGMVHAPLCPLLLPKGRGRVDGSVLRGNPVLEEGCSHAALAQPS